jgi:hypothetical protein
LILGAIRFSSKKEKGEDPDKSGFHKAQQASPLSDNMELSTHRGGVHLRPVGS